MCKTQKQSRWHLDNDGKFCNADNEPKLSKAIRDHICVAAKNMFVIVYWFVQFSILWVNKLLSAWILTNIQIT